ncbi:MAG: tRNA-dihydrouridine synthase family protein [Bacilli bacterium]|nr:tRNA-dihydrouridine synthase family protein [Bacilli bacterium]
MFKLGKFDIEGKVLLAPMAGITNNGYREFMIPFGVDLCVTEMVSDMGLIYGNKETKEYVTFKHSDCPTGVQLFGHDPECIKKAAEIALNLNPDIDFFDVNMGCPVPKVTNTGAGSALMKNPKLCGDIVRAIKSVTDKPVTAKIRLGWDDKSINYLEVINELEEAGVAMIGIHARTRKELYMGTPHYDLLKDLRDKMTVPLAVSGNIYTLDDAINALEITKADMVMVARGGVGNPYLISQINHYFKTGERLDNPTLEQQINYCYALADSLIEDKGEDRAMRIYRGIATKFFNGFPNCKVLKAKIAQELVTRQDLTNFIELYLAHERKE